MSSEFPIILSMIAFLFTCISFVFVRGEAKHKCVTDIEVDISEIKTNIDWIKRSLNNNKKT